MSICGVDEAGRGSVLGPLVVAGVCAGEEEAESFLGIKVRDSKKLSPQQRSRLYEKIKANFKFEVLKISAERLNKLMERKNLNEIEVEAFAHVIKKLGPGKAFADSADVNAARFREDILGVLRQEDVEGVEVVAEHQAEDKHKVVAAASIVAKVERDREIELLHRKYGDFGSGYPADARTINFLRAYFGKEGRFPEEARTKWKTLEGIKTKKLSEFK